MGEKKRTSIEWHRLRSHLSHYPENLFGCLQRISGLRDTPVYLTGGALRDWLLDAAPMDLDFTIERGSIEFAAQVEAELGGGNLVDLGRDSDDTCRLVLPNLVLDFNGFRRGTTTIEEDLGRRDFTINALGIEVGQLGPPAAKMVEIIDPCSGLEDLEAGLIRACPDAFVDDPLRMLRAFRFAAQFGYAIVPETLQAIGQSAGLISRSAVERINHECDCIMQSSRGCGGFTAMAEAGLLERIAPELWLGDKVGQPAFHHLDVLQHNLAALCSLEQVIEAPAAFFPGCERGLVNYLEDPLNGSILKWAALFHDVGKPLVKRRNPDKGNRITFYNHDGEGSRLFLEFADRYRWSKRAKQRVASLISMHMHPFHLLNTRMSSGELSRRARLKICRKAGGELPGLFMLAMADCLAGKGVDRPPDMEQDLAQLYCELDELYRDTMQPLLAGPKLLTGKDLIATLGLEPGPLFSAVLEHVETARLEGDISDREEALAWARRYLEEHL